MEVDTGAQGLVISGSVPQELGEIASEGLEPLYGIGAGDDLPASHNAVTEEACRLLGTAPPPLQTLEEADLSPMARGFYAENRRVANIKAKRVLGWQPAYPTYREGLVACLAASDPPGLADGGLG